MAQTKKTKTVVDAEVIVETTPRTKAKRKVAVKTVEEQLPAIERLGDDGGFDVTSLSAKEKEMYATITRNLKSNDIDSITSYGSELSRAMDSYSTEFLSQRFSAQKNDKSSELMKNLVCELKRVDIGDFEKQSAFKVFLSSIPIINRGIMTLDRLKVKYNTMQQVIDKITEKLEGSRLLLLRDNTLLEQQYEANVNNVEQLGHLIIGGKMKSAEIAVDIENLQNQPQSYKTIQEIANLQDYKDQLDKHIYDMSMLRLAFINSLPQIKMIQKTNMTQATNIESQISMTIPLWKSNLSLAVALYNQKQGIMVDQMVRSTNDELMRSLSSKLRDQAVEVAKLSQQSAFSIDTLKQTVQDTIAAIEGVNKAIQEGAQERAKHEIELRQLESKIYETSKAHAGISAQVIAKELRQSELMSPSN